MSMLTRVLYVYRRVLNQDVPCDPTGLSTLIPQQRFQPVVSWHGELKGGEANHGFIILNVS